MKPTQEELDNLNKGQTLIKDGIIYWRSVYGTLHNRNI